MKSSRLLTTGSVITRSRPESGRRKTQFYWIHTHTRKTTKLIHLWQKGSRDKVAWVFELTNKIMSTVLRTPKVTLTSAEVNIMPHDSIKSIRCCPLRRGHNVQFSSEMTLAGVKTHQQHRDEPALVDKWPELWRAVATALRPCDINSNNPESPCCKDRLQIAERRTEAGSGGTAHQVFCW